MFKENFLFSILTALKPLKSSTDIHFYTNFKAMHTIFMYSLHLFGTEGTDEVLE